MQRLKNKKTYIGIAIILLAFLIYSYDIYVQNLFPLKGTGGKALRGILVGGFLLFLNVLPRFTADLWRY